MATARSIFCIALISTLGIALHQQQALGCSLCDASLRNQNTFRQEFDEAKIVLYGSLLNPKLTKLSTGTGTTEFHIEKVVKNDPALGGRKMLELQQYIPVLDPKNPPKYVVFVAIKDGQINLYRGRQVLSDAVLKYLDGIQALRGKDRTAQLQFFFEHLGDKDIAISSDAFLEFARSNDADLGAIAKHLPSDQLRKMLQDSSTPTERLAIYAFLLGAGGNDKEAAALLRKMIEEPTARTSPALDGLLSGYTNLKPREGWDLAASLLADSKKPFTERIAVARMVRVYHAWKPAETEKEVLR
jgi:hypothetical protein